MCATYNRLLIFHKNSLKDNLALLNGFGGAVVSFAGKAALANSKVHLEETQLARKTNVVGIVVSV